MLMPDPLGDIERRLSSGPASTVALSIIADVSVEELRALIKRSSLPITFDGTLWRLAPRKAGDPLLRVVARR